MGVALMGPVGGGRLSGNVIRGQINGGGTLLRAMSGDGDVSLRGI